MVEDPSINIVPIFLNPWIFKEKKLSEHIQVQSVVFQKAYTAWIKEDKKHSPIHPQSAGIVKRFNSNLEINLKMNVRDYQSDWDSRIPLFWLAYNTGNTLLVQAIEKNFGQDYVRKLKNHSTIIEIDRVKRRILNK